MRTLPHVIDKILERIPVEEKTQSLIARLKSTRRSGEFAAPEMMRVFWKECQDALVEEIGDPVEDWQKKVALIFSGQEVNDDTV